MSDKVFKDFEVFVEMFTKCRANDGTSYSKLLSDVLELLKSQQKEIKRLKEHEAVEPKYKERMGGFVAGLCPTCGTALNNILNIEACGKCGQEAKWE